jgi:hypothetical protein
MRDSAREITAFHVGDDQDNSSVLPRSSGSSTPSYARPGLMNPGLGGAETGRDSVLDWRDRITKRQDFEKIIFGIWILTGSVRRQSDRAGTFFNAKTSRTKSFGNVQRFSITKRDRRLRRWPRPLSRVVAFEFIELNRSKRPREQELKHSCNSRRR